MSIESDLGKYLDGTTNRSEFVIRYHIGDDFSTETQFDLRGDGAFDLWSTATHGRQRRTFSGQLDINQVQQVVTALQETRFWEVQHIKTHPGEDDPEASIAVTAGGDSFQVTLWVSEIRHSPIFNKAQQLLLALVHEISGGQVLENGQ